MSCKKTSIFIVSLLLSISAFTQGSWTFAGPTDGAGSSGPENGRAICTDANGNVYITGNFNGSGVATDFDLNSASTNTFTASSPDGFIASYDKNGNFRWKTIVSGTATDFGAPSGTICTNGTFVWVGGTCNVSGSAPAPTIISSTNTLTITSPGTGVDNFVAKLNCSNGATVWQQGFGGSGANDFAMGICVDPNGSCYVSGSYSGAFTLGSINAPAINGTISDVYIAKFDPNGTMIHFITGGSTVQDMVNAGSGLVYVPGATPALVATGHTGAATASFGSFTGLVNTGAFDAFLVELDTALSNFTNALVFGSTGSDELLSATYDPYSQAVYVSGFCSGSITFPGTATLTGLGGQDIILARYNVATNNFTWSSIAGGLSNDRGWCITADGRGGILLSGFTLSAPCTFSGSVSIPTNAGLNDLYVAHYNPSGTPIWVLTSASTGSEEARGIASYVETIPVYKQNIFVTGITNGATAPFGAFSAGNDGGTDFFLAKLTDASAPLLPLKLISFNGTAQNGGNLLLWKTANEINTKSFELQSSSDGVNFVSFASVDARGSGDNSYRYSDQRAFYDKIYYRLKMTDLDGSYTYSHIISINNKSLGITVSPNPVTDKVNIRGALAGTNIQLTDANGKVLKSVQVTQTVFTMDMSRYPAGLYFIKTENGWSQQIIKE